MHVERRTSQKSNVHNDIVVDILRQKNEEHLNILESKIFELKKLSEQINQDVVESNVFFTMMVSL